MQNEFNRQQAMNALRQQFGMGGGNRAQIRFANEQRYYQDAGDGVFPELNGVLTNPALQGLEQNLEMMRTRVSQTGSAGIRVLHGGEWRSISWMKKGGANNNAEIKREGRLIARHPVFKYLRAKVTLQNAVKRLNFFAAQNEETQRYILTGVPQNDAQARLKAYRQNYALIAKAASNYNPQAALDRWNTFAENRAARIAASGQRVTAIRQFGFGGGGNAPFIAQMQFGGGGGGGGQVVNL